MKTLLFWTLLFPIAMSTFFNLAFSQIMSGEAMKTIDVAIINSDILTDDFLEMAKSLEFSKDNKMFNITLTNQDEALKLLNDDKVAGVIEIKSAQEIELTLSKGGIGQTIIKSFLDEYLQKSEAVVSIVGLNGNADVNEIIKQLLISKEYLEDKKTGTSAPNTVLNYFYSLIGMALIYGGFWGNEAIIRLQPNLSGQGLRVAISPTKRFKLLIIHLGAAFIIHFIEIFIFLLYMIFVLGVEIKNDFPLLLLTCGLGSFTGISFGAFISIVFKNVKEGTKIAITSLTGIVGGFLAGMMNEKVKYLVQTKAPIVGYINPVNVISDALYSLYYYPTLDRYLLNIGILVVMSLVFVIGTFICFRRDSYESI
jgi:ABC-2 type transport system permease protein